MIYLALSESDKRVIIALLLVFILVFVIIGFLGSLVVRVMKKQSKQLDTLCHDVVVTRVVNNKKEFKRYARKKNHMQFFKESFIPLLIVLGAWLVWIITCAIRRDFNYDLWDYEKEGINTLFFVWDFSDCYANFFGLNLINRWPDVLLNTPHFSVDAIGYYIFVPAFLTGAIWYLITVQRLIARTFRIKQLSDSIYSKSLDDFNLNEQRMNEMQQNMMNAGQTFDTLKAQEEAKENGTSEDNANL